MATNQTGIAIVIKAFLPTGKTLDETFTALSIVKQAHETGDYAPLLAVAKVEEVKTEQKTRRVDVAPQTKDATDAEPEVAQVQNAAEFSSRRAGGGSGERGHSAAVGDVGVTADPVTA